MIFFIPAGFFSQFPGFMPVLTPGSRNAANQVLVAACG
jgi:hypothetical protein